MLLNISDSSLYNLFFLKLTEEDNIKQSIFVMPEIKNFSSIVNLVKMWYIISSQIKVMHFHLKGDF